MTNKYSCISISTKILSVLNHNLKLKEKVKSCSIVSTLSKNDSDLAIHLLARKLKFSIKVLIIITVLY